MNIAIDARKIIELGIGSYIRGLLGGLSRMSLDERYLILVPSAHRHIVPAPLEPVVLDLPNHGLTEVFRLGRLIEELKIDVFHSPFVSVPRTKKPCVVSLHDAITQQFPSRNPLAAWYYAHMNRRAARLATRVMTGSHAAKTDIVEVIGVPPEKVVVAYDGVDSDFFRQDIAPNTAYGRYFLYVGGDGAHKNVAGLLKAFAQVRARHPELRLVLAGGRFDRYRAQDGVIKTGFVTREELIALYRGARAVVMASFVEGFGLPVVEAWAAGTPVLTSMAAALLEVSGDAAFHADARRPGEFGHAMATVANDDELRAKLIAAGRQRVQMFNWDACARTTRQVYLDVARLNA